MRITSEGFPPHARGWTVCANAAATRERVSPARAGMDLSDRSRRPTCNRFPRTRGDGPVAADGIRRKRRPVSPARGGDGPRVAPKGSDRITAGFPRTRGDGPYFRNGAGTQR